MRLRRRASTTDAILKEKSLETMWSRPDGGQTMKGKPREVYYGCGWSVRPAGANVGRKANISTGYIGSRRQHWCGACDGLDWAVLFNTDGGRNLCPSASTRSSTVPPIR